jgi:hypothetical protein
MISNLRARIKLSLYLPGRRTASNHPENRYQNYRGKEEGEKNAATGKGEEKSRQSLNAQRRKNAVNGSSAMTVGAEYCPSGCDTAERQKHNVLRCYHDDLTALICETHVDELFFGSLYSCVHDPRRRKINSIARLKFNTKSSMSRVHLWDW